MSKSATSEESDDPEPSPHSRLLVLNRQRRHPVDAARVRRFLADLAVQLGKPAASLSVMFVSDDKMRRYNRDYRGMDKTTDVLSFPAGDDYLGDILISVETAYKQARQSPTLTYETNIHRLLLHGFLHLAGYDHEADDGEMRALERRLRRKFRC